MQVARIEHHAGARLVDIDEKQRRSRLGGFVNALVDDARCQLAVIWPQTAFELFEFGGVQGIKAVHQPVIEHQIAGNEQRGRARCCGSGVIERKSGADRLHR